MRSIVFGMVTAFVTLLLAIGAGTAVEYGVSGDVASPGTQVAEWTVDGVPSGIATDLGGNVFVSFNEAKKIVKYSLTGDALGEFSVDGVIETNGIVVGPEGEVVASVASSSGAAGGEKRMVAPGSVFRVVKYSGDGDVLIEWTVDGVIETNGIAAARGGETYLGINKDTVIKFGPDGTVMTSWGVEGEMSGLAVNPAGEVLVSFRDSPKVARFSPDGEMLSELTVDGVIETNGIVIGPDGSILLLDLDNKVVKLSASGEHLADWTIDGEVSGIAAGLEGRLYAADSANSRVVVFQI